MAIKKSIPTDTGINAEYFHILKIEDWPRQGFAHVTLGGYATEELRFSGKQPLWQQTTTVNYNGGQLTQTSIYNFLKAMPMFEGAEDV